MPSGVVSSPARTRPASVSSCSRAFSSGRDQIFLRWAWSVCSPANRMIWSLGVKCSVIASSRGASARPFLGTPQVVRPWGRGHPGGKPSGSAARTPQPKIELRRLADMTDVGGVGPLGAAGHVEFDLVVLLEVAIPRALDGAEVDEHIGSTILGDEPETLLSVEPFHGSGSHWQSLLSWPTPDVAHPVAPDSQPGRELLEAIPRTAPCRQTSSLALPMGAGNERT